VALSYHYRPEIEPAKPLRSAIAVPLEVDGVRIGFLAVYSGTEDAPVEAEAFATLEAIAEHAGPAIGNARRFQAAGRQAAGDTVTSLPSRRAFHEALVRGVERAHRFGHPLSLLLVDIDGLRNLTGSHGHAVGEEAIGELEQALRAATREQDLICRVGADAFAVILVNALRIEAEAQFARVQATLRRGAARADYPLTVSGGIGELRPDDDAVSLLDLADAALRRAKEAGKGTAA
jgi:diguanylate cyclase (GGDEF)-like protein